ncbi:hypothetical protein COO60DRAFT_1121096 [Scenedesmus sp. NREL 46B-D3]|nr:hypothetical protein COO60DRAFT_1121096 [Scenedesmus sp. NREL 46B-D3]
MEYVRPSILHRPARNGSNCTLESAEEQWRKEQELLAAKSRRLQNAETRLLNALYPTSEHVKARQAEVQELQEQHMAAKAEAKRREAQLEAQISQGYRSSAMRGQQLQLQSQEVGPVRPWATSTLSYATDLEEREARKHFATQTAADNLAVMADRAAQRKKQQQEQQLLDRQVVTSESEFWNLGASSRRWIAPEHRHLAPPSPTAQSAAAAAAAAREAAAAGRAAATYAAPPWATHSGLAPTAAPAGAPQAAMPSPWATQSAAATSSWAAKASDLAPPWATTTSQPADSSIHAGLPGAGATLQRPGSSAGRVSGSRDTSSGRPHTAAGFECDPAYSQRTSHKPQPVRKYPWEWQE